MNQSRLAAALQPSQKWLGVGSCEAGLGHGLRKLGGQVCSKDEGATPAMERVFPCQRLCILVGDKSLLILKENDMKMKYLFK